MRGSNLTCRRAGCGQLARDSCRYDRVHDITRYRPPGEYRSTSDPGVDRSRIHRARPACERSSCRAEEAARSRAEGVEAAPGGARAAGQITRLEPARSEEHNV